MMSGDNKTFRFRTNIKCGGCVATVSPFLNAARGIIHWEVDTAGINKTLTVHSSGISEEEVIRIVQEAGYKIEVLP